MSSSRNDPGQAVGVLLPKLRQARPLVHCISNTVTAQFVANALYAVGARPIFCVDPLEAEHMAGQADALVVNLGTLDAGRRLAIEKAVPKAKTWVLDPVGIAGLSARLSLAKKLLGQGPEGPAAVRGNASEILAFDDELFQAAKAGGVDALHDVGAAAPVAKHLAGASKTVFALTGTKDFVAGRSADGSTRMVQLSGGHALMSQITGMGCALTAITAAFLAVADDSPDGRFEAVVAAVHLVNAAGGHAGAQESTKGPASFAVNWIDALSRVGAR